MLQQAPLPFLIDPDAQTLAVIDHWKHMRFPNQLMAIIEDNDLTLSCTNGALTCTHWPGHFIMTLEQASYLCTFPNTYICRFENLVGPRGGGSLDRQHHEVKKIAKILGVKLKKRQIEKVSKNLWGRSWTFNKGKIGEWKKHFNKWHKRAFKERYSELLADLGYEQNNNW